MGCSSSKNIQSDVINTTHRPSSSSFSIFDVYAIQDPWKKTGEDDQKPPILEKLNTIEDAPRSLEEVDKVLEDIKSTLIKPTVAAIDTAAKITTTPPLSPPQESSAALPITTSLRRKNLSFHTPESENISISIPLQSIEKTKPLPVDNSVKKFELEKFQLPKTNNEEKKDGNHSDNGVPSSMKDNMFIIRDKLEREQEGKSASFVRRNPLSDFPTLCPPGGADKVVLYTTSLGGVRRTYDDCESVRSLLETHQVVFDERDVSLHGGFLKELKDVLGEGSVSLPRVFVKGRYIGGAEEFVKLSENGRLARILNWARVERGVGRMGCEGCGGARFVPCLDCNYNKDRCGECNENGLVYCPFCS